MKVAALRFLTCCYVGIGIVLLAMSYFGFLLFAKSGADISARDWTYELPNRVSATGVDKRTSIITETEFTVLSARPLFAQTRKPFVVKEEPIILEPPPPEPVAAVQVEVPALLPMPAIAPVADPSSFRLMGTSKIDQDLRALISDLEHPEGRWLVLDESIMDWIIKDIKPHEIILMHQGRRFTLKQYVENTTQPLVPVQQNQ